MMSTPKPLHDTSADRSTKARSVARVARQGTQAAHAHLHEIECF